jgi:hypothetical protein
MQFSFSFRHWAGFRLLGEKLQKKKEENNMGFDS